MCWHTCITEVGPSSTEAAYPLRELLLKVLQLLLREITLTQKMASSPLLKAWVASERDPRVIHLDSPGVIPLTGSKGTPCTFWDLTRAT